MKSDNFVFYIIKETEKQVQSGYCQHPIYTKMRLRMGRRYYIKFVILIMICGAGLYYYFAKAAETMDKRSQMYV